MKNPLRSCVALIVLLASPVMAADMAVKAPPKLPPVAAAYSWTGFYVGANIGGGWGDRDVSLTPNDSIAALFILPPSSFKIDGVLGGAQFGYNWQLNQTWLVGFETDFDWSNIRGSSTISGTPGVGFPFTSTVDEHIKWFGTVRGRLGFLPIDNLLLYGTGGFAYGKVEHTGSVTNISSVGIVAIGSPFTCPAATTCFAGSSGGTTTGQTAGGGIEWAFLGHWSLKGEYLYVSLDSNSFTETAVVSGGASMTANYGRTNFNVVRGGLNYKF